MERKRVGHIVNTFGIKGGLKVVLTTSYPEERFKNGNKIILNENGKEITYEVDYYQVKNDKVIALYLKGINDINLIEKYVNYDIYMDVEQIPGTYYFDQLVKMTLVDKLGNVVDTVKDVIETPSILHLTTSSNKDLPFQENIFYEKVDLENNKIYLTDLGVEVLKI